MKIYEVGGPANLYAKIEANSRVEACAKLDKMLENIGVSCDSDFDAYPVESKKGADGAEDKS